MQNCNLNKKKRPKPPFLFKQQRYEQRHQNNKNRKNVSYKRHRISKTTGGISNPRDVAFSDSNSEVLIFFIILIFLHDRLFILRYPKCFSSIPPT